ncbi:MAG: hypothetical protein P2A85_24870 [Microcoleus anatoxicus]|uniref:hypothetical protein n=1 Tax=Microcoleus anatoxicus TaxID=2705319 RepID=UPI00366E5FDC
MFSPIPLTPMLLNPDDSQDGNTSQDSGHHDHTHDHTDVNTSHNLDDNNGDRKAIDDYYGNIDESSYNSSYNIDQGDRYGYNDYSQYLVQPDNNYQSTDCYSDPQPEGIDYQESSCDYDCDYSDYGRGNDNYSSD